MNSDAGKHIKHAVPLLTFAKTKKKICLVLRAAVLNIRIILFLCLHDYTRLQMSCEFLLFYDDGFYFITFCAVMPQCSETLICVTCIVYALAMIVRILFGLDTRSSPLNIKNSWGSKIKPIYIHLLTFKLQ